MNPPVPSLPPKGRIHVLQIVGNAIVGGMETYVGRLIEGLPRERFAITALCPDEGAFADRLRALGVEVLITPMPPEDPPWNSIQLACALVRTGGIDLLHAHLPNAHVLAGIVGRLVDRPVLSTIHGRQLTTLDVEVQRATGSHLCVVCRQSYFHALGMGISAAQLSCITNGVDTVAFKPATKHGNGALRASLGLERAVPLAGFVGRLSPEKGPEVFLRAAKLLQHMAPSAHCVMVGDGPLRKVMAEAIEQLGLQGRVHLAGMLDDMAAVYHELDVLVSTSHSEAMPLALMEGMACGLPVVATRVGGVPDLVVHGVTGWLVEPRDFEATASRTAALLAKPALRATLGAAGRTRVLDRFSLAANMTETGELLARLVPAVATPRRMAGLAPTADAVEMSAVAAAGSALVGTGESIGGRQRNA